MEVEERNLFVQGLVPWCAKLVYTRYTGRDREDVLQSALLKLLKAAPTFDPARGKPSTWCAAVIGNMLANRSAAAEARRQLMFVQLPPRMEDVRQREAEDVHDDGEQFEKVREVMASLGDADRELLLRVFVDGLPIAHLDRSLTRERCRQKVKAALGRARKLMTTGSLFPPFSQPSLESNDVR